MGAGPRGPREVRRRRARRLRRRSPCVPGADRLAATLGHRSPAWWFDEFAHAGDEHLDPEYAAAYDAKAQADPEPDLELLVDLGLDSTSTLIDLGSGTGRFALAAARMCAHVVAVDVSPAMLAVATAEADRLHIGNVRFLQAGFLTYDHAGSPVDFVYSRNALHHLPEFWKAVALERVALVLKPGGYFRLRDLVFSFDPADAHQRIEDWLASAPLRAREGWTRSEREKDLREEHITFSWLLEPMLERAGFQVTDVEYDDSQVYGAYTCRRRS